MKELNKKQLIELFNSTKQSNPEKSLDEIYQKIEKINKEN